MRLILPLLLALFLAACGERKETSLSLLLSCDTEGRLEPCGCFDGQLGGIARISTLAAGMKPAEIPLRLDAGNFHPGTTDYEKLLLPFVLKAYQHAGFDALNAGCREARLGADELRQIASQFPQMISANLLGPDGKPVLAPFLVTSKNGTSILIAGIVDPALASPLLGPGLSAAEPSAALQQVLASAPKAQLRVLLAFADTPMQQQLAARFPEFDLVLGGAVAQPSQKLLHAGRATLMSTTNKGKNAALLQGRLGPDGFTPDNFDIPLLPPSVPQDPAILALSSEYRKLAARTVFTCDAAEADSASSIPGASRAAGFTGSQACLACHQSAHAVHSASAHAHAFESLKKNGSDTDPRCLTCHTVGFGQSGGYRRSMAGGPLAGVGCESCHGPGSEHVRQRSSGRTRLFAFRRLGDGDCRTCHQGEFSRPFSFDQSWPKIHHGKEAKAEPVPQSPPASPAETTK
ncbi:MAG: hypothetical protein RL095_3092 [Verrucomicrobiota bacterium]|jgi:hypothetical protein